MTNQRNKRWGATPEEWDAFLNLAPADIRPVASCPIIIDDETGEVDTSRMKVPSMFVGDIARRMKDWPTHVVTTGDLASWRSDPRHGICLVTRDIRALDVDVEDPELAEQIDDFWCDWFDADLPVRARYGSPRRALLYRILTEEGHTDISRKKMSVVLPSHSKTNTSMVEFSFTRSHIVVAGCHHSVTSGGSPADFRYTWPEGIPESLDDIPTITPQRLAEGVERFIEEFEGVASRVFDAEEDEAEAYTREREQIVRTDPIYQYVVAHECFREELPNGTLAVQCPWHTMHSNPHLDALDPTKTVFFPVGLGDSADAGFSCQHTSHGPKNIADFLDAIGYSVLEEFEVVEEEPVTTTLATPEGALVELEICPPAFIRMTKSGSIPCNEINLDLALKWPAGLGVEVGLDEFKGSMMIRGVSERRGTLGSWKPFADEDYVEISKRLIGMNFMAVNFQMMVRSIHYEAVRNKFDSAKEWARGLQWDGEDRITGFAPRVLGAADTPYSQAVIDYLLTALAGRVLTPGVKADMSPVLVGAQGLMKTSFVKALAPTPDTFSEQDLSARDADMARELRGKLVVELGELRGIGSRDEDSIKSWMSRDKEEWIPKYKEHPTTYLRRFIMVGTTNNQRFLADATGNRRWLPMRVGVSRLQIDVDWVLENREQLWAQAMEIYKDKGILWQAAERLAHGERDLYMRSDPVYLMLSQWIAAEGYRYYGPRGFDIIEVAAALGHGVRQGVSVHKAHVDLSKAFQLLGYEENLPGYFELPFL